MWTRLECDAPGATIPAGSSALASSTGQTYQELSSYSYNDIQADWASGGDGNPAEVEVIQQTAPVELLLIGTLSGIAFVVALFATGLFFRRRALARNHQANGAIKIAKPVVPESVAAVDAESRTESFEGITSSEASSAV